MTTRDGTDTLQMVLVRSRRRRRMIALVSGVIAVTTAACNGGLPTPSRDAAQGQTMLDLAEALNQIRDQSASMQDQVDSLREVVAKQDTVIHQLANAAGIVMKPQ
ncbi:MAG: hypothetical protein ABJB66_03405 [Gemmatimonadaceae bacterium]